MAPLLCFPARAGMNRRRLTRSTDAPNAMRWNRFALRRSSGGGSRGADFGYGFAIEFAEPVHGPIAFGYGARQCLGQFETAP